MDSQCYNNVMVDAMVGGEALENKKLLVVFTSYYFGDKADKILTELEVPSSIDGYTSRALRYVWFICANRSKYCRAGSDYFKRT